MSPFFLDSFISTTLIINYESIPQTLQFIRNKREGLLKKKWRKEFKKLCEYFNPSHKKKVKIKIYFKKKYYSALLYNKKYDWW